MYPKGTPIRLYSMEGEQSVPPGSRGVVDHVDDIGQIHMKWENGSCLALNIEVDRFDYHYTAGRYFRKERAGVY